MTGHAPTVAAETVYAGRHRGAVPAPRRITPRLYVIDGLYRQTSADSGIHYWSTDGNYWHTSPEAARQAS